MAGGKKVFVGISGGVDSAVSAALLQKEGYEVTGVFIKITIEGYPCTAGVDRIDAMRVAAHLGILFREIDLSAEYKQRVFDISVAEFAQGRTPNPDALCNREIKFGLFYDYAIQNGADMIATGHYAQLNRGRTSVELMAGADTEKDQSYFLALVPETVLQKTLFPIGHLHKPQVRALAAKFGLPNAARKDSQGLCFLGPVSMHDMLERELAPTEGRVVDAAGAVVGTHHGTQLYTLGQRHGFAIAHTTPESAAQYVVGKDVTTNTLTVSANKFPQDAATTHVELSAVNLVGAGTATHARYRYRQPLIPYHNGLLLEPHYVPVGQVLALYNGDRCLGGGIISAAWLSSSPKRMEN